MIKFCVEMFLLIVICICWYKCGWRSGYQAAQKDMLAAYNEGRFLETLADWIDDLMS